MMEKRKQTQRSVEDMDADAQAEWFRAMYARSFKEMNVKLSELEVEGVTASRFRPVTDGVSGGREGATAAPEQVPLCVLPSSLCLCLSLCALCVRVCVAAYLAHPDSGRGQIVLSRLEGVAGGCAEQEAVRSP